MKFNSVKNKIQDGINRGADRFLSPKVKDELGFNKPTIDSLQVLSQSDGIDSDLNNFYKPVNSTFLSTRDYKNIQAWAIGLILVLIAALLFLFFSLITPNKDYSNTLGDTQIIVDGNTINEDELNQIAKEEAEELKAQEEKIEEDKEELKVENITVSQTSTEKLAQSSPLLQSNKVTLIEYRIRSGDTLEKIAMRFYGSQSPDSIQKIKTANKIRNVRLLQIGQKLIIPM